MDIETLAYAAGFSQLAPLNMASLKFLPEVREMCSADRCKSYGKSWSCPPACGSLESISRRAAAYSKGIIVQTTGELADEFDLEALQKTEEIHKARFDTLVRQAKRIYPRLLPMSAGACRRCVRCTYPEKPCRYPSRLYPSMEAYGLLVGDICRESGLKYYYGEKTITYTACILLE